jgi:hypothetical protein
MKRDAFKSFPKVERIVEFSEKDVRKNTDVTSVDDSLISGKAWQKFAENALVITDGHTIYQYAEEFPIVVYRCSEDAMLMPSRRLNAFIESITVSTADLGKHFWLERNDMKWEYTGPDTVAYFTDNTGRVIAIQQNDIFRFLLNKPNLVISNEGLLIFFTEKSILVTVDCEHYAWVHDVDTKNGEITSIDVYEEYCIVNLENRENHDEDGNPMKYSYTLQFVVDMIDHGMITPEITKN